MKGLAWMRRIDSGRNAQTSRVRVRYRRFRRRMLNSARHA
jgi:hypothetical protein